MLRALPEFARFLFAGALNTGISYAAYLLLLTFLPYLAAYAISYLLGIVLSYLLLTRFVFRAPPRLGSAMRFPLVYVAQYLFGSAVLALLVEAFDIPASIAAIVAIVVSIPVTFQLSRIVLRDRT